MTLEMHTSVQYTSSFSFITKLDEVLKMTHSYEHSSHSFPRPVKHTECHNTHHQQLFKSSVNGTSLNLVKMKPLLQIQISKEYQQKCNVSQSSFLSQRPCQNIPNTEHFHSQHNAIFSKTFSKPRVCDSGRLINIMNAEEEQFELRRQTYSWHIICSYLF